jgi:hypothetical protein
MSHEAMVELSASVLDQVAGGLATPYIPPGATNIRFVSNGPNGVETGWEFTTAAGLTNFISAQPDEAFDAAP